MPPPALTEAAALHVSLTLTGADMPTTLKLSRYIVTSDDLYCGRAHFDGRVIFSTRSGAVMTITRRAWEALSHGRFDYFDDAQRARLEQAEFLVPSAQDELAVMIGQNQDAIAASDTLYQVVQPSAWCQLDCSYCGQEHERHALAAAEQDKFIARVRQRIAGGSYRHLKIGWFGAEPLVGLAVIRTLTKEARAVASEYGCGYSARIVTNGLALTPAMARELVYDHAIDEAEVTLDGTAAEHDRLRYTKTGKGSFARIFANLTAVAHEGHMKLVVRCNVSRANAHGVTPLIEKLAAAGLAPLVSFYTSPVYAWGNDAHETALGQDEFAAMELDWLALQARLGFNVGLVPQRRRIVCMSVQRQGEVTDAFGATYNCTEVPYVPAYGKPNAYEIRIPADSIKVRPRQQEAPALRLRHFNEQILEGEHRQCASCVMLPVCGGQCPKSWEESHPPCPSAKHNMKGRLNMLYALAQPAETDHAY